jgi:hypothetical protein
LAVDAAVGSNVLTLVKYLKFMTLAVCLCLMSAVSTAQSTQRSLLLVSGSDSQLDVLTHAEVRKVFLGVPVTTGQVRLRPLLNFTDPRATNIFLQQVIFMSERKYKRQLLSRVFRLGDQRPREYDDINLLVEDVRNTPGALTFMWSDQFEGFTGLKSLGVLWTSSNI